MRPQPLICVSDVEALSRWCGCLLGCESAHGGAEYERLVCGGRLVPQLHNFEVDDFDAAMRRGDELKPEIVTPRHRNSDARHRECWLRDCDGYLIALASCDMSAA